MMTNMDTLKKELKYVQETLIRSIQAISRVSMSESKSEQVTKGSAIFLIRWNRRVLLQDALLTDTVL